MSLAALDRLNEALSALAAIDVAALPEQELHELCIGVQRARQQLGAEAALLTARWDRSKVWASNQSLSAPQRLANELSCSARTARLELRRARKLARMPHVAQAVREGRLSLDMADTLGRANSGRRRELFAAHEAGLVEECRKLRYRDAQAAVAYWRMQADALVGTPPPPADPPSAFLSPVGDRWALNGDLDTVGGNIVNDELDRLIQQLKLSDREAGIERTTAQRRAAALTGMALRSSAAPGSGNPRRPLFTVHVGEGTVANLCELSNGMVIHPSQLAGWIDTALLEVLLFDGPFTVIAASQRRTFTGALRRAIEVRDRHCGHPSGCEIPAERCDVDHVIPFEEGGRTTQFNGRLECPGHNRIPALHDTDAVPLPERPVTAADQLRARLKWRYLRDHPDVA